MKTNPKTTRPSKQTPKRPETIEERVHRHITDINSEITDDDIKSVKTELDIRRDSTKQPEEETNKKQKKNSRRSKKENQETGKEKQTTPWDLLSEGYE